jgi:imidazolonepropionase-like amidohydrolase
VATAALSTDHTILEGVKFHADDVLVSFGMAMSWPGYAIPDRSEGLAMIDAAYTLGVEGRFGTIETGKFADFAVLEADPQDVDPMEIKDIGVVATILGGRVTLTAETREPPAK